MKEKLVVIDGNSIVNRAFYGLPDLTTTDGRHTNGVLGFLNILIKGVSISPDECKDVGPEISAGSKRKAR